MKHKVISSKEVFQPFTIEITAESPEELRELWHRFGCDTDQLKSLSTVNGKASNEFANIFFEVVEELSRQNLSI
jgi:hypothetical protein